MIPELKAFGWQKKTGNGRQAPVETELDPYIAIIVNTAQPNFIRDTASAS